MREFLVCVLLIMVMFSYDEWKRMYSDRTEAIRGCTPTEAPIVEQSGRRAG